MTTIQRDMEEQYDNISMTYISLAHLSHLSSFSHPSALMHYTNLKLSINAHLFDNVTWTYPIPELGEGGSCSLFGKLASEPFDISVPLGGKSANARRLVSVATAATHYYRENTKSADWFGVYIIIKEKEKDNPSLLKLSYFGAPSRPLFPLTKEFADISNNSNVGMTSMGRVINNVKQYVADGNPYYTCDPKVKSEACLPIFDRETSRIIGIVDSESFKEDAFAEGEYELLIGVVCALGEMLGSDNS